MKCMTKTMIAVLGLAGLVAGCQSSKDPAIPAAYYQGTALERNSIGVAAQTEYLRVNLNPMDSQLRQTEIRKIKGFLAQYKRSGHGPLIMSMPKNFANPQLAVEATAEARDLAWKAGIEYHQIAGSAYEAGGVADAPLILAFKSFDAIAPDCPQLSTIDFADASSNNDLPTLGCAVRANMAAMIADPADLLGQRDLEPGDPLRRATQLGAWREGSPTGAERSDEESGAISSAVE